MLAFRPAFGYYINRRFTAAVRTIINNGGYLTEEFTENGRRVLKFEISL